MMGLVFAGTWGILSPTKVAVHTVEFWVVRPVKMGLRMCVFGVRTVQLSFTKGGVCVQTGTA